MFGPNQFAQPLNQNWMPNYGTTVPTQQPNQFYGNNGMRNFPTEQNQSPMQYNTQQPMTQQSIQNFSQQPTQPQTSTNQTSFNGRIVDGIDMVKAIDVPFGGYGVFPRADMKEIYVKGWNPNGTTSTLVYSPVAPSEAPVQMSDNNTVQNDFVNVLLAKVNQLEEKIDSLLEPKVNTNHNETTKEALF